MEDRMQFRLLLCVIFSTLFLHHGIAQPLTLSDEHKDILETAMFDLVDQQDRVSERCSFEYYVDFLSVKKKDGKGGNSGYFGRQARMEAQAKVLFRHDAHGWDGSKWLSWEATLFDGTTFLVSSALRSNFEVDANPPEGSTKRGFRRSEFNDFAPFSACVGMTADYSRHIMGRNFILPRFQEMKLVGAYAEGPNLTGVYTMDAVNRDGSKAIRWNTFTFSSERDYLPVAAQSWKLADGANSVEEMTIEKLATLPFFWNKRIEWTKVDGEWVPEKIVHVEEQITKSIENTWLFFNWKLGDDVDQDLIDRQKFKQVSHQKEAYELFKKLDPLVSDILTRPTKG